jgi:hypothetical protein
MILKRASDEVRVECAKLLSELMNFDVTQKKLDQEKDDQVLMKESDMKYIVFE